MLEVSRKTISFNLINILSHNCEAWISNKTSKPDTSTNFYHLTSFGYMSILYFRTSTTFAKDKSLCDKDFSYDIRDNLFVEICV